MLLREPALLDVIRSLLQERSKCEEPVIYDETPNASPSDIFNNFNENVITDVGPQGGAMDHHHWAVCHRDVAYDIHVGGDIRRSVGAFSDLRDPVRRAQLPRKTGYDYQPGGCY